MPPIKAEDAYERAVTDLYAAFREPGRKTSIAPEDTTALVVKDNMIKVLTYGDIAEAFVMAGWRPAAR